MVLVVMGVSGCGKSTVGLLVARALGVPFHDADAYHPEGNVRKMKSGVPLTDEDRRPWLETLAGRIAQWEEEGGAVLACSALKQRYRDLLVSRSAGRVLFVHLSGSKERIAGRMRARSGHYMPASLLDSQFEALEAPADAITVSIEPPPEQIAASVVQAVNERRKEATLLFRGGDEHGFLSEADLRAGLREALDRLGSVREMLIVPPDITRLHSMAGVLTEEAYRHCGRAVRAILPALGTHVAMTPSELSAMFGAVPRDLFVEHRWRTDCVTLGEIPEPFVREVSGGAVSYPIPVSVNRLLVERSWDCILSVGQVVPHEVAGMAGHNKNLFVGLGGAENIHKSHYLGAAYGIERIMGRLASPVRRVFDCATGAFMKDLPVVHALTVMDRDADGRIRPRGLFVGAGGECYRAAANLSMRVNIELLDDPLQKAVVFLDPAEYRTFWLGNKSVYRTRMAIADGGELIVLAPGVRRYGEDPDIDALIAEHGYRGTPHVARCLEASPALRANLSAAAHLIHGSSEGRFTITYCTREMDRAAVEKVGYRCAPLEEMMNRYNPAALRPGENRLPDGERVYFIPNPATGLWAGRDRFQRAGGAARAQSTP